jgi:hypothetical protein
MAVSSCFYGAPGEIRTPDLVVRSHAFFFAFITRIIDPIGHWVSHEIVSKGELRLVSMGHR